MLINIFTTLFLIQIPKLMKPGTHFAFTVEALPNELQCSKGYRLLPSGRFGYKKSYIDNVVAKNHLDVVV